MSMRRTGYSRKATNRNVSAFIAHMKSTADEHKRQLAQDDASSSPASLKDVTQRTTIESLALAVAEPEPRGSVGKARLRKRSADAVGIKTIGRSAKRHSPDKKVDEELSPQSSDHFSARVSWARKNRQRSCNTFESGMSRAKKEYDQKRQMPSGTKIYTLISPTSTNDGLRPSSKATVNMSQNPRESDSITCSTNILTLPDNVLASIFYLIPDTCRILQPWLKAGMLRWGPYSANYDDEDVVVGPNLDLSFLRVNKHFYELGTSAIYGHHTFWFVNPDVALWWFKKIGPRNIMRIRTLRVDLGTGWALRKFGCPDFMVGKDWLAPTRSAQEPAGWTLDRCCEQKWLQAFSVYIQPYHDLDSLIISFTAWQELTLYHTKDRFSNIEGNVEDRAIILNARQRLLGFLRTHLRGVRKVHVINGEGLWLNKESATDLIRIIQLSQETKHYRTERRTFSSPDVLKPFDVSQLLNSPGFLATQNGCPAA